jgi:diguanylate cyclase (GGDEF)-like protein
MWARLAKDFQLAIITLFGLLAAVGISPFAAYRFAQGNLLIGFIDAGIVAGILAAVVYAWRSGDTRRAGLFLMTVNTSGVVLASALLGYPGLFWAFPALFANYMLVDRSKAVAASALALTAIVLLGKGLDSTLQTILFVVTASIASLFAYIFAHRTEVQRRQLEAAAAIDALTGAQNRRVLDDELQIAVQRFERDGTPAAMLMLDLDHFKAVNDRHGHAVGDQVLVDFSAIVRAATRRVDRFFRYGGEEFVLLLSPVSSQSMRTIADKLVAKVGSELRCRGEPVTVSIGAAALRPGDDARAWMARADASLYLAKSLGRNRAEVAPAHDAPAAPSPDGSAADLVQQK